jgi:hypothetical protein
MFQDEISDKCVFEFGDWSHNEMGYDIFGWPIVLMGNSHGLNSVKFSVGAKYPSSKAEEFRHGFCRKSVDHKLSLQNLRSCKRNLQMVWILATNAMNIATEEKQEKSEELREILPNYVVRCSFPLYSNKDFRIFRYLHTEGRSV